MTLTNQAISAAMRASPTTPREEVIKILTAAKSMPADLPPLPWHVNESFSRGRNPVALVSLEGSNGEQVCLWIGRENENGGALRARAQFFMRAAEAYLSNQD
jgi:hypothetical protein